MSHLERARAKNWIDRVKNQMAFEYKLILSPSECSELRQKVRRPASKSWHV
jgi:hypothetical protein